MTLKADITAKVSYTLSKTLNDRNPEENRVIEKVLNILDGTAALQAQQVFSDKRTLAASANETLDLNGTALKNVFGDNFSITKLLALLIIADAANVNDVQFGPNSSNGLVTPFGATADRLKVKPNGFAMLVAPDATGFVVTAGTGDLLYVANGGAGSSVTYTVIAIGS